MSTTQQTETVELSSLNDEQKQEYLSERLKKFKLTFIVCIVYGIIAIILLLLAVFTSWGNRVLYSEMFAFIITFIIGTIIIIFVLANEIYSFKPTKSINSVGYDSQVCPDYWKLEYVKDVNPKDSDNHSYFLDVKNLNQFKYKCILDNSILNAEKFKESDLAKAEAQRKNYKIVQDEITKAKKLYVPLVDKSQIGMNSDEDYEKFKAYAATMSGYNYQNSKLSANNNFAIKDSNQAFNENIIPLACDTVYPMYLANLDRDNSEKNPSEASNKYRCAFAKACGMPWTEAGCS
jgi:hypothetical protein